MPDSRLTPYGMTRHHVEFEISQLLGVPQKTHASGTRLYISERLSSLILEVRLARLYLTVLKPNVSRVSSHEIRASEGRAHLETVPSHDQSVTKA